MDDFFVKLKEPENFKRTLAEGSQSIINIIELQKKIEESQEQRRKCFTLLTNNLEDVKKLLTHLEGFLPKKEIKKITPQIKKTHSVATIEEELNRVDKKLSGLKKKTIVKDKKRNKK